MKKAIYILPLVIMMVISYGFLKISQGDPNADQSPTLNSEVTPPLEGDTTPPAGFPFPTRFNFNYSTIAPPNAGTVGAIYVNGRYYFNRWNLTELYLFDNTGPNQGPGTMIGSPITYTGAIRDMCWDGRYLYGGKAASVIYRLDTGNLAIVTQFTVTGIVRAIAWDPNRRGFWIADFAGNITCRDTANNLKGTITTTLAAKYGLAWDSTLAQDSAFVWAWDQTTLTSNGLNKFHAASGILKASYLFTLPGSQVGTAGGAEIFTYPGTPPRLVILLNYQNVAVVGYNMKDLLTAIENNTSQVRNFSLGQNYPNPFNPNTKIAFHLMKASDVVLEIFDVNGQLVKTLINGYMQAGPHKMDFNAANLSSGTYFYKITSNGYTETKKMLLVK